MVDGGAWFITPEGPFKTLTDLWSYEEETGDVPNSRWSPQRFCEG